MVESWIFLAMLFIAYIILFYYLVKEHKKHISLTKKYQKLKYDYDDTNKDAYYNFVNAEKERNMKHEVITVVNLLGKEGFNYKIIHSIQPPENAIPGTVYYSEDFEKYFIVYDKDNIHVFSASDVFEYPKGIH